MLVVAVVHSRLDYGNGVLVGLLAYLMRRLQSVLNAAARLIYRLRTRDHITDALISLHWLRVPERIQYKLAVMHHVTVSTICQDDDHSALPTPTASWYRQSNCQQSAAEPLRLQMPTDVVAANSLSTFRRLLKRFFIPATIP